MRRGLAMLLVVAIGASPVAFAQPGPGDASAQADAGTSPPSGASLSPAPPPGAAPVGAAPLVPSTAHERESVHTNPLREVPIATWICGGVAAALLGVGLGFGISAANIDHRAGVSLSPTGVDLGLTRRTVLAGQTDAVVANGLFVGAGVVALVGLAFAAFAPEPASRWQTPAAGGAP